MSKITPLNSNEINQIPERYTTIPEAEGLSHEKMINILLGLSQGSEISKTDVLNELFKNVDNLIPMDKGEIKITTDMMAFIDSLDEKSNNNDKPKQTNTPSPNAPGFNKKKDLKKPIPYVSI